MDIIDVANDRAEADLERCIKAARNCVPHEIGPELCTNCDEPMHAVRRQAGYQHCTACAAVKEHHDRLYWGRSHA